MGTQNQALKLTVDYDGKKLTGGLKTSSGEFVNFGKKGQIATSKAKQGLVSIETQLNKTRSTLKGFVGAWATLEGLRIAKGVIDGQINLRTAISRTIESQDQFNQRQQTLLDLANRTRSDMGETVKLFVKIKEPMESFGKSTNDTLQFIELFQKSLKKYPTTALQAASSTQQLSQALGSNNFAGDEFKSLAENAQGFMEALRDGVEAVTGASDLTIADLKKMASEGKLTTELVTAAIATQAETIEKTYGSALLSIDDGITHLANKVKTELGNADASFGVGNGLAHGLVAIADNLDLVGDAATVAFALLVASSGGATAKIIQTNLARMASDRAAALATIESNVQIAKAEQIRAAQQVKLALIEKKASADRILGLTAELSAQKRASLSTVQHTAALNALSVAKTKGVTASNALAAAELRATATTNTLAAATTRATLLMRGMAGASALLGGSLALVGGPVGALALGMMALLGTNNEVSNSFWWVTKRIDELITTTSALEKEQAISEKSWGNLEKAVNHARQAVTNYSHQSEEQRKSSKATIESNIVLAESYLKVQSSALQAAMAEDMKNRSDTSFSFFDNEEMEAERYSKIVSLISKNIEKGTANLRTLRSSYEALGTTTSSSGFGKGGSADIDKEIERLAMHNAKLRLSKIEYYKLTDAYKSANTAEKGVLLNLFKSNLALEEKTKATTKAGKATTKASAETIKAADKIKAAIESEIKAAQDKIDKLTMSDEAYERTRLKALGFKDALLEEQVALWKTKTALESKAESLEKHKKKQAELKKAYDDLRKSNALEIALLKATGNQYIAVEIAATKYSDAQKKILINEAMQIRNAQMRKQIMDDSGSKNLELDYQINVQDGSLTEDQQRVATDKAAVSFERAKLKADGYSASIVDLKGIELSAIQVKERLAEKQLKVADIVRYSNAQLLDHHKKTTLSTADYEAWKITLEGVDEATAKMIVKRRKTIELESEFANIVDGEVTDALKSMVNTGNDALDSLIAKLFEAMIAGDDLGGIFGGLFGGGKSGGSSGFFGSIGTSISDFFKGIPPYANGGDHSGGFAIVGEKGPELVNMGASRVFNADQTKAILSGGGNGSAVQVINNTYITNQSSAQVEKREEQNDSGGTDTFVLIKKIERGLAHNAKNNDSVLLDVFQQKSAR